MGFVFSFELVSKNVLMNKVILIGHLGQDPEIKQVGDNSVCTFSLATSKKWLDKKTGEVKSSTEWHNCEAWRKTGEIISKFHCKGDRIAIEGEINYQSTEHEGVKKYYTKINVRGFEFVKDKADVSPVAATAEAGGKNDLPF